MHSPDYGPWEVGGYQVRLEFARGVRLAVSRDGAPVAGLPRTVRESGDLAWMRVVLGAAAQHRRLLKALLEDGMVEGRPLSEEDLAALALDAVGAQLLGALVIETGGAVGLPRTETWMLEGPEGEQSPLDAPARVVHPLRLESEGTLLGWRRWLAQEGIRQPFKQAYRELFAPAPRDLETETFSETFAGARARWDQGRALLEGRGWYRVTKTGAERIFRRAGLTAHLELRAGAVHLRAREVVTLGRVFWLAWRELPVNRASPGMPVAEVPPEVFSESMRDVALVAQVAGR